MLIDCDSCGVRGLACGGCVVTVLLGAAPEGVHLDAEERAALDVLAASGLVPPLRLVLAADAAAGRREDARDDWDAGRDVGRDAGCDAGRDTGCDEGWEDGVGYVVRYDTQRHPARDTG